MHADKTSTPDFSLSVRGKGNGNIDIKEFLEKVTALLKSVRKINVDIVDDGPPGIVSTPESSSIIDSLVQLSSTLADHQKKLESDALRNAITKSLERKEFGGLGLNNSVDISAADRREVLFLVEAWLETLNSQERARKTPMPLLEKSTKTRPMTLAEKIFAHHNVGNTPIEGLKSGALVTTAIDWVLASEGSWSGMKQTFDEIGETQIWRNDRFWMAGDHMVEPRIMDRPRVQKLVRVAEQAKRDFKMTEYQGMNYTIMHTEFVRERAQPGMLVLGSDSHTCSAGAVGSLAIGLGAADVAIALATGETWFKIPESILVHFTGKPSFGMTGKDVILYILKQLKRNTVAADRIVEFSGPGAQWLSCDARFAICNMCAELGAITGIFVPDAITQDYISSRKLKVNRSNSLYFQPDKDAQYAETFVIELSNVESTIAVYPSPDNVVPVSEKLGVHLDGVFIGACTTTEEELILAALVLKVGLREGLPLKAGKRRVTPGSLPIVEKLRSLGLLDIFEAAGFTRGVPGCSYCIAMAADEAAPGETWLSSQNRNFKNRMGPGSFGSITSAATVAASSFGMQVNDPRPFLEKIDVEFFKKVTKYASPVTASCVVYSHPRVGPVHQSPNVSKVVPIGKAPKIRGLEDIGTDLTVIKSRVKRLEDFIDTDALAPSNWLAAGLKNDDELGQHCLEYTHPEFRQQVKNGLQVVVAGKAFGCGSSREQAVSALKACGVRAVIARSFAFIFSRNQPSLGLLGIVMHNEDFYNAASEGELIEIDIPARQINVSGDKVFKFQMAEMEWRLTVNRGLSTAYRKFGKALWQHMTEWDGATEIADQKEVTLGSADTRLQW